MSEVTERYLYVSSTGGGNMRVPSPPKIEAFLDAYEKLCREHGLSLSPEDGYGGFEIEVFDENNIAWVRQAAIGPTLDENGNAHKESRE